MDYGWWLRGQERKYWWYAQEAAMWTGLLLYYNKEKVL